MDLRPPEETPITRAYSMRMLQIARLSDLSHRLGMDQSEIVRRAIDEYYARHQEQPQPEPAEKPGA